MYNPSFYKFTVLLQSDGRCNLLELDATMRSVQDIKTVFERAVAPLALVFLLLGYWGELWNHVSIFGWRAIASCTLLLNLFWVWRVFTARDPGTGFSSNSTPVYGVKMHIVAVGILVSIVVLTVTAFYVERPKEKYAFELTIRNDSNNSVVLPREGSLLFLGMNSIKVEKVIQKVNIEVLNGPLEVPTDTSLRVAVSCADKDSILETIGDHDTILRIQFTTPKNRQLTTSVGLAGSLPDDVTLVIPEDELVEIRDIRVLVSDPAEEVSPSPTFSRVQLSFKNTSKQTVLVTACGMDVKHIWRVCTFNGVASALDPSEEYHIPIPHNLSIGRYAVAGSFLHKLDPGETDSVIITMKHQPVHGVVQQTPDERRVFMGRPGKLLGLLRASFYLQVGESHHVDSGDYLLASPSNAIWDKPTDPIVYFEDRVSRSIGGELGVANEIRNNIRILQELENSSAELQAQVICPQVAGFLELTRATRAAAQPPDENLDPVDLSETAQVILDMCQKQARTIFDQPDYEVSGPELKLTNPPKFVREAFDGSNETVDVFGHIIEDIARLELRRAYFKKHLPEEAVFDAAFTKMERSLRHRARLVSSKGSYVRILLSRISEFESPFQTALNEWALTRGSEPCVQEDPPIDTPEVKIVTNEGVNVYYVPRWNWHDNTDWLGPVVDGTSLHLRGCYIFKWVSDVGTSISGYTIKPEQETLVLRD